MQSAGDRVGIFNTKNFTYHDVPMHSTNEHATKAEKKIRIDEEGNIMVVIANHELLTYNEQRDEKDFPYRYDCDNFFQLMH